MAKVTKAIQVYDETDNCKAIGLVWESNGKEVVILNKNVELDINNGITVVDVNTNKEIYIDLIDLITKTLNELN